MYFEIMAGKTIPDWMSHHLEGCALMLDGKNVFTVPLKDAPANHPKCLKLTRYECQIGLTSARWSDIGATLFLLYTKEKQCHPHPKP